MTENVRKRAFEFAQKAHKGQGRKYTLEPYVNHVIAVAQSTMGTIHDSDKVFAAALLHDVVEDTIFTDADIRKEFGDDIADLVAELTDNTLDAGNRKTRKALDRARLEKASAEAHTIKLCDLLDNTKSIVEYDPNFAPVYMKEKRELLKVLTKGDPRKLAEAQKFIDDYFSDKIEGGFGGKVAKSKKRRS